VRFNLDTREMACVFVLLSFTLKFIGWQIKQRYPERGKHAKKYLDLRNNMFSFGWIRFNVDHLQ
jgi:hypothetical protein